MLSQLSLLIGLGQYAARRGENIKHMQSKEVDVKPNRNKQHWVREN